MVNFIRDKRVFQQEGGGRGPGPYNDRPQFRPDVVSRPPKAQPFGSNNQLAALTAAMQESNRIQEEALALQKKQFENQKTATETVKELYEASMRGIGDAFNNAKGLPSQYGQAMTDSGVTGGVSRAGTGAALGALVGNVGRLSKMIAVLGTRAVGLLNPIGIALQTVVFALSGIGTNPRFVKSMQDMKRIFVEEIQPALSQISEVVVPIIRGTLTFAAQFFSEFIAKPIQNVAIDLLRAVFNGVTDIVTGLANIFQGMKNLNFNQIVVGLGQTFFESIGNFVGTILNSLISNVVDVFDLGFDMSEYISEYGDGKYHGIAGFLVDKGFQLEDWMYRTIDNLLTNTRDAYYDFVDGIFDPSEGLIAKTADNIKTSIQISYNGLMFFARESFANTVNFFTNGEQEGTFAYGAKRMKERVSNAFSDMWNKLTDPSELSKTSIVAAFGMILPTVSNALGPNGSGIFAQTIGAAIDSTKKFFSFKDADGNPIDFSLYDLVEYNFAQMKTAFVTGLSEMILFFRITPAQMAVEAKIKLETMKTKLIDAIGDFVQMLSEIIPAVTVMAIEKVREYTGGVIFSQEALFEAQDNLAKIRTAGYQSDGTRAGEANARMAALLAEKQALQDLLDRARSNRDATNASIISNTNIGGDSVSISLNNNGDQSRDPTAEAINFNLNQQINLGLY